jgi:hypothetical protein
MTLRLQYKTSVMKKILLLIDHENPSLACLDFVRQLSWKENIVLSGVFIPHYYYNYIFNYGVLGGEGITTFPVQEKDPALLQKAVSDFENFCADNRIEYTVYKELDDFALPALKKESRFADLVILSPNSFAALENDDEELLRNFIHGAECPCLVIPDAGEFPEMNIIAYDGSDEAVFAMKQFSYLFPHLAKNVTLLVYAEDRVEGIPLEDNITDLAKQHFPDFRLEKLDMNPKKYFSGWLSRKQNPVLISGSFGRSVLSEIISSSFVDDVLKKQICPVFIAHK